MSINDGLLLVVVAFFACLLYFIHQEGPPGAERRQSDRPHPAERRRQGLSAALARAGRALRSPFTHH